MDTDPGQNKELQENPDKIKPLPVRIVKDCEAVAQSALGSLKH